MAPAEGRSDPPRGARRIVQPVVAAIGVDLQDAGEASKIALGMLLSSIPRSVIEGGWRRATPKGVGHRGHWSR